MRSWLTVCQREIHAEPFPAIFSSVFWQVDPRPIREVQHFFVDDRA